MRRPLLEFEAPGLNLRLVGKVPAHVAKGEDAVYSVIGAQTEMSLTLPHQPLVQAGSGWQGPPVLFENGDYDLYLSGPTGLNLHCDDHPSLLEKVGDLPAAPGTVLTHYRMAFANDVGHVRLSVRRGRTSLVMLIAEVFPTKIGYKSDYRAIISDLSRIGHNLIFAAMSKTNFATGLVETKGALEVEWFRILQRLFRDLLAVVDQINRQPQRRLRSQAGWRTASHARLLDPHRLNKALAKPGNIRARVDSSTQEAGLSGWSVSELPVRDWSSGYDTSANRYLRWSLEAIVRRLLRLKQWLASQARQEVASPTWAAYTVSWAQLIDEMLPQLQHRLSYAFLAEAGPYSGGSLPTAYQSHPIYAKYFQIASTLKQSLTIESEEFAYIGAKPIWMLYEYWCYAAILDILARRLEFISGDIVQRSDGGSQLSIRKGIEGSVMFRCPTSGRLVRVIYNRLYPTPTTWQRPDAVVHVDTGEELHVFDAKYRVQSDESYMATYGGPGPMLDDINTMHRYRDAIVNTALPHFPRIVRSAVVLFPGLGDGYSEHRFLKTIPTLGVGALPFLPSQTALVAERLESILETALG